MHLNSFFFIMRDDLTKDKLTEIMFIYNRLPGMQVTSEFLTFFQPAERMRGF